MLRSMTGYARATAQSDGMTATVTLKSVNHRYLDLHLRLPAELDFLESKLRQAVRARLTRGHIELNVSLDRPAGVEVRFDHALVKGYLSALATLRQETGIEGAPDLDALLRIPGVLSVGGPTENGQSEKTEALLLSTLEQAITSLDAMRADEARFLKQEMRGRTTILEQAAAAIENLRLGADRQVFERLRDRVTELAGQVTDRDRIALEAALLVERSDVSEEILRLKSHVQQFVEMLDRPPAGEAGKRLDFLLQEMNREANTILSKTAGLGEVGLQITEKAIQAKVEIEKLREQVQNLQ